MHRFSVWVCCLAVLAGCESHTVVSVQSSIVTIKHPEFTELRSDQIVSNVKVLDTMPPTTLAYMIDAGEQLSYASRTEHDCSAHTSTLKHLAVYNSKQVLIRESNVELELDVMPGSLGEAELMLACNNLKGSV